ncbi:MAG: DUF1269 domain-containing protein [Actinomycetes bacterium]
MSDETTTPAVPGDDELIVDAAAVSDGAYTLIVADFNDTEVAWEAYELLKSLEDGRTVEIEGVVVVKKGDDGKLEIQKVTDHATRRGLGWGVVGGIVLGVIFPPSILASAVVVGAAGAASGALVERHHKKELADELQDSIDPGHSGIIALVSNPSVVEIEKALDKADRVVAKAVDKVAAEEMKAAAKDAEAEAKAEGDKAEGDKA